MAKKTSPRRTSAPGKTQKAKKMTVHRSHNKGAAFRGVNNPEAVLQETVSGNPTEEMDRGTANVIQSVAALNSKSDAQPTQPVDQAGLERPLTNSSVIPPVVADARKVVEIPEDESQEGNEVLELLAFKLADEEYAVDILKIKEIIRPVEITRVPRRPSFIKGIISLRGKIIPIFDLRTRLGLVESLPSRDTRNLVVGLEKGSIGVIADGVTGVVKVTVRDIEPPPAVGAGSSSGHLKGVTRVNGRLVILLDLEKAVTLEES